MRRKRISSGSRFEKEVGYSRAIAVGDMVFVSGTTGYDYATMTISEDVAQQAETCIKNIEKALLDRSYSANRSDVCFASRWMRLSLRPN